MTHVVRSQEIINTNVEVNLGGLKRCLERGDVTSPPKSKKGKDTVEAVVLSGGTFEENTLTDLFQMGVSGPTMHGRQKRLPKGGEFGEKTGSIEAFIRGS